MKSQQHWLNINRGLLLNRNVPVLEVLDVLVTNDVFNPSEDDYQSIKAESTPRARMRALLDALTNKDVDALQQFKAALCQICPQLFRSCVEPACALDELDKAIRASYIETACKVRQMAWFKQSHGMSPCTFFLNLSMIDKNVAKLMMNERAASSAREIERRDYLYSRAVQEKQVCLDKLFAQYHVESSEATKPSAMVTEAHMEPLAKRPCVELSGTSIAPEIAHSRQEARTHHLETARFVAIYAGAGCGKTSCLSKAASMYANNQLWPGLRALIFWRLRDPKVKQATDLKQLIEALHLKLSKDKCEQFADCLMLSKGRGVLFALDGVDEFDGACRDAFVWKLLDRQSMDDLMPEACVLVTSRPCSFAKQFFDDYQVNLELVGFTEDQVEQFIEQQLHDNSTILQNLHRALIESPNLASLMQVPLLAKLTCDVFRLRAEGPPTSRTYIFSTLLALAVKRSMDRVEGRISLPRGDAEDLMAASDLLEMTGKAKRLVRQLAMLAFLAHQQNKTIFDHKFVMKEAHCSIDALRLGLLCSHSVQQGVAIVPHYSFQHLTIQEFLVAYHLVASVTSDKKLQKHVRDLLSSTHNDVVLKFFAGLIAQRHHRPFFALVNQWLHEDYDYESKECRRRLRVSLQCAGEACGDNVEDFPDTLTLPGTTVDLDHVTAAEVNLLCSAVQCSPHIKGIQLNFDPLKDETNERKASRIEAQTRQAMTRLMDAIHLSTFLRGLHLFGPVSYSLFEDEGRRLLAQTVESDFLEVLAVCGCPFDEPFCQYFSNALKPNKKLKWLYLTQDGLNDLTVCMLSDVLQYNNTLQVLDLRTNSYGDDIRKRLRRQLSHIPTLLL